MARKVEQKKHEAKSAKEKFEGNPNKAAKLGDIITLSNDNMRLQEEIDKLWEEINSLKGKVVLRK